MGSSKRVNLHDTFIVNAGFYLQHAFSSPLGYHQMSLLLPSGPGGDSVEKRLPGLFKVTVRAPSAALAAIVTFAVACVRL